MEERREEKIKEVKSCDWNRGDGSKRRGEERGEQRRDVCNVCNQQAVHPTLRVNVCVFVHMCSFVGWCVHECVYMNLSVGESVHPCLCVLYLFTCVCVC